MNSKFRVEQTQKENLFQLNEKLSKALKRANMKIAEVKERYKSKISKKCYYCNNDLEISVNMNSTFDQVQMTTQMNESFNHTFENKRTKVKDDDNNLEDQLDRSFNHKQFQDDNDDDEDLMGGDFISNNVDGNNINLLDNLLVEDSNP